MNGMNWLRIGAILGGLAVATGAFGAHGFERVLIRGSIRPPGPDVYQFVRRSPDGIDPDRMLATYETAVRYHMYHALGLVAVGLLVLARGRSRATCVAGWSFLVGIVLFSGSLYALALSGIKWLGAITPIGGVLFLVGWAALAVHRPGPGPKPVEAQEI